MVALVLAGYALLVFAAYLLRGATGFGAGVVAIPLMALTMPLAVVIPVITTLGIVASLGQSVQEIRHVDWRALRGLALPSAIGVSLGLWLFASLDQRFLLRAFAVFITVYGLWSLAPRRPRPRLPRGVLAAAAGGSGGLVATLFGGMAGPFYVIYLKALQLDKRRFRASISSVLLCLGVVPRSRGPAAFASGRCPPSGRTCSPWSAAFRRARTPGARAALSRVRWRCRR